MLSVCATTPAKSGETLAQLQQSLGELIRNSEKRNAVSGNLLITTELDGHSVTAPAVLLAEFPDTLRLEIQDPVGGILVLLVLNGERFWLYQNNRPEILTGPVRKLPPTFLPVPAQELVRIVLARPVEDRLRRSALSEGKAVFRSESLLESVLWSGGSPEVEEWRQSPPGKGGASALYQDYEFKKELRYPTKIRLAGRLSERAEREALLVWKDWEPSVPKEKKLFQIPQQETFGRKIKELR